MSERSGVEIDYCPDCRGVWLDRGELDKILEKSKASEAAVVQPQMQQQPSQPMMPPQQHQQHSGYYQKPYKRKKSFLEEIFD